MKQLRWIWILGIAAVLLIGIFIVVDINSDKKEKAKHIGDAKQLLQIDTSKITHMSLKNEEGTFGFKWDDTNQTWVQTEGDPFNVNPYVISAIVNYASHLESIKTVAFDSKDKAVYGFNDPIEIRIFTTDTDDEHPYIINVGDNTPTYDAYYAMIGGSDEIYTIDYNSGTIFCSSKNAMKDAYLFNTTASQVSYIRVEKNGKTEFEIGRDSERAWQLLEPAGFSLAKAYVDELSDDIVHITVDSFVEDNPADLAKYGLDKPDRKVFRRRSGSAHRYPTTRTKPIFTAILQPASRFSSSKRRRPPLQTDSSHRCCSPTAPISQQRMWSRWKSTWARSVTSRQRSAST